MNHLSTLLPRILLAGAILACFSTESQAALSDEVAVVRGRILAPLLEPPDERTVRRLVDTIQPDGVWPDVDYADSRRSGWRTYRHLANVLTLARAYKSPGFAWREDPALGKALFAALEHWLKEDFQNSNWWWNQIGVPKSLANTLLLLDDELTDAQRTKGLEIVARAKLGMTGQNLVWVAQITAARAILENDAELLTKAYQAIADEIRVSLGEGIQPDMSFHQHGPCLYSHGYGAGFATDCSRIATEVADTRFAFAQGKVDLLAALILDGHQWLTFGPTPDHGAIGRQISRRGQKAGYLAAVAENMLLLPTGRADEFEALAARAAGKPDAPPLLGNRHFWRADTMTHHGRGFYTSARMFSSRLANTDMPCNSEGLTSHHIADGCNLIYRTGREYTDIFPVWDWQKIPGTTVEQTPELVGPVRRMGQRDFVGGVSDGTFGLAAFDMVRDGLKAKKAWFFLDDRFFVCLGAGITCDSEHPVATTVNQCFSASDAVFSTKSLVAMPPPIPMTFDPRQGWTWVEELPWAHHDEILYVFPGSPRVSLSDRIQTGSWQTLNGRESDDPVSHRVFTLGFDHGPRPRNATYAYIVAPNVARGEADKRASTIDARIVRNDADAQAVACGSTLGACFYEPGTVGEDGGPELTVDQPCLVLLRETAEGLRVSVSNPRNAPLAVRLTVNRRVSDDDVELSDDDRTSSFTMDLPDGMEAGRSVTRSFK